MLYIQGQELRDTGDDLMAVNADETQPDLAGMGVRGITEWEWNSVEWGNFFIIELVCCCCCKSDIGRFLQFLA